MIEKFIKTLEPVVSKIHPDWLILGALMVAAFTLAIGLVMTVRTAAVMSKGNSAQQVIRSRLRRNIIFSVTYAFVILAVIVIFKKFPGNDAVLYLAVPALVLLGAIVFESIFEYIDDMNRKKAGVKVCFCNNECPGCTAMGANREARYAETNDAIKRTREFERERQELEQWREEISEVKSLSTAEEEDLRRRKFENERKQLSILARQVQAIPFGRGNSNSIEPKKPAVRPAAVRPAEAALPSELDTIIVSKPVPTVAVTMPAAAAKNPESNSGSVEERFNRLQAKLDKLRQQDASDAQKTAVKPENRGKYDEDKVKSALSDLIRSMNARRNRLDEN